jgi:V8-like Glu-specific endopeptidase/subtilisin family serine protease
MSTSTTERLFMTTNLDPALAEAVEAAPADRILEGIIRLEDPSQVPPDFRVVSRFDRICTGRFAAERTWTIRRNPNVISFKASQPLGFHDDDLRAVDPFDIQSWTKGENQPLPFTGRGCIVAALDFGLDFAHPNFLNPDGTTRLLAFWDQGATYDPAHPNRFGYGRQYTPAEINAALRAADPYRALGYSPQQSDTGKGSHGTHTLDIAAGNGRAAGARPGAASEAWLMFVHLSTRRLGTSENLGDSVRLLEALDWVDTTARGRPWVVNLSVGSTAGSHDGTSLVEQGMHELLRKGDGRAISQSGGNYRSADLAVHGRLEDGEHRDLSWIIDPADTTPNELDAWYSGKDRFIVALRPPQGTKFLQVKLGEALAIVIGGAVVGRIYHRKNDPNNGDNHVAIFLYINAPPGVWTLRFTGDYVITGRFHAWIERDLAKPGAQSRFDPGIASQAYTLGTIATSPLVITVGAYDAHAEDAPLAPFSSCGPTRDGRRDKPELLAPGVDVLAARSIPRGATRQLGLLVERSGTSMAAPHVTGVVAALFEAAGLPVSIEVIRECLKRSARQQVHADEADCCAWGRLDAAAAIQAMLAWVKSEPIAATERIEADDRHRAARQNAPRACDRRGDAMSYDLDRAEQVLQSTARGRRESETWFLQGLLREIDPEMLLGMSPAQLFQDLLRHGQPSERIRGILEIVARPFEQPDQPLRPGDMMLRATPGTGDIGHVMVLVSSDLRTPSALAADGVIAESTAPGQYGMVIEAGAFPHDRSAPYARRWLDGRGRVPPNSLILRPSASQDDPYLDLPAGGPTQESESNSEDFSAPAWLGGRADRRTADPGVEEQATPAPPAPTKTRVRDQFAIPFRWMARVSLEKRGSEDSHGSGVLISDVHVLTAAHVVWNATVSPAEYSVNVTLARDGGNFLEDRIGVSRIDIPKRYKDGGNVFDYALLTLDSPMADRVYKDLGGVRLCYWGSSTCGAGTTAKPVDPASLNGQVAITAGYPNDKGGNEMWVVTGTMSRSVGGTVAIHYTGQLIEGQSGSPAWIEQNGERNIVGLVVSRGTFNRLYPLSWDMVEELNGWMLRAEKKPQLQTESESETEFEGDQSENHELEAGGNIVLPETAEGELEEDDVAPKGLALLDHVHISKAPDPLHPGTFTIGSSTKLVAADLNPQFYDSTGVLKLDSGPTGLQTCLEVMMKTSFGGFLGRAGQTSPHPDDVAHVAVVDLTGAKRSAPEFAAWDASVDMYGASVPKILALYAAFQLRSDMRDLMTRKSPPDGKQFEAAAIAEWNAKGYKTDLPDLVWLFDIRKWTPPSGLDFTPAARDTFANIVHNCPAGTLIKKVRMPFIGSVAWQSGLYHPMRSGLWLRASYCNNGTWASPVKTPWVHNMTALSAATYFTLLVQGRLVDTASSTDIKNALRGGCVTRLFPSLPVVASKCGWYDGWIHDCAWIEDGSVRYVMAVLSHQTKPAHEAVYTQLCAQIDTLVRLNNQTPKASCL